MTLHRLRAVVIDCPIKHWNHPIVRQMFHKMVNLKLIGFRSKMPDNYLPVDTSDYIGTHIMVCRENGNGELHPIMAFKGISLERCHQYGQQFAGRSCISSAHSDLHKMALEQYIESSIEGGHALAYTSSFAVDPDLDRGAKLEAMKLLFPLVALYRLDFGISRLLALGSIKTKTNVTFRKLGFHPLVHAGEMIPPVNIPAFQNERFEAMAMEHPSVECESSANAIQAWWDARIEISDKSLSMENGTPQSRLS